MDFKSVINEMSENQLVLVGLGEEFECREYLTSIDRYNEICHELKISALEWMVPYINYHYLKNNNKLIKSLNNLKESLDGKNYFIITTCMSGIIESIGFDQDKLVSPCGNFSKMQCIDKNCSSIINTPDCFLQAIDDYCEGISKLEDIKDIVCDKCGKEMVFNSLFAEEYNEAGYLEMWGKYMDWLQHTLNKKLLVLEFGCSLMFMGVIRVPFEKTVFYNQKAKLIRIHDNLYQTPADIKERGIGINSNSITFLV